MRPDDAEPLETFFKEGMAARERGETIRDNPYGAGSRERREWNAGFCATADAEREDELDLDPNENAERRSGG